MTVGPAAADGGAQSSPSAAEQPDRQIEMLLRKVEQQVISGKTVTLDSDNALATWGQMLERVFPFSPAKVKALQDFVADVQSRAARENAAGQRFVATDLNLFGNEALKLLIDQSTGSAIPPRASSAAQAPIVAPDSTTDTAVGSAEDVTPQAVTPQAVTPPAVTPQVAAAQAATPRAVTPPEVTPPAATPPATTPQVDTAQAGGDTGLAASTVPLEHAAVYAPATAPDVDGTLVAASPAPASLDPDNPPVAAVAALPKVVTALPKAARALPPATTVPKPKAVSDAAASPPSPAADLCAQRGAAMLAIKDISAARKYYECAADAGSATAALILAQTYDPRFAAWMGTVGIRPDPAAAAAWYRKAEALGDQAAESRSPVGTVSAAR